LPALSVVLHLATVGNYDRLGGLPTARAHLFHGADHIHAFDYAAKDNVLAVEPGGYYGG
jgi:hypothetical protein